MLITTSRKPSIRTKQFCRDLASVFPNSFYKPRSNKKIEDFLEQAKYENDFLMIIEEEKAKPCALRLLEPKENFFSEKAFLRIANTKLRKEILGKEKFPSRAEDLRIDSKTDKFFRNFESQDDSDFVLKANGKNHSFFFIEKEIGPSFEAV
jgi:rRNA maturation protein Rpf1